MYKKILLAADGSKHSKRAAENAIHLAKANSHSHVEVVYVIDHDKVKSDVLSNWNSADMKDKYKERIQEIEHLVTKSKVSFEIKILHGDPGPTIVDYANNNHFDLVVIGSRGLNGLQEFMLGSVSHKVAIRVNCPVLIVK